MNISTTDRTICDLLKEVARDDRKHALTIKLRSGDTITAYGPIEVADRFMLCRLHDNNYEGNQIIAIDTIEMIR
ncbi:Uncharacterised protein [Starkeya nomas]|uniref:Uncharacterized protein n=2 Tax=Xanthobacteraceae TaxID=335928 RepID=A0A5S9NB55_9HYPH|nr:MULTISPECIES: hypothetical protein [Xanthobacteraceae]TSJ64709.1 hypothetical protein FO470_05500 [Ancylobacter moscoviensis]CAA0086360.1 Uncharacterised protein [Starkeya nomas]